uniref:10 kDa heat shock protein, mitochondrial n=1 Tax=Brugia malayi TaxID=6279 RepID=A0A1I9GCQ5_BRUMA|nr:Bm13879 [Brugia malayi]
MFHCCIISLSVRSLYFTCHVILLFYHVSVERYDRRLSNHPKKKSLIMASMSVARKALGDLIKAFKPLSDRVLVERFAAETKTKGGIMIPDKAQGKVLEATVISTGPGGRDSKGNLVPMTVQAGDHVLLPEYGGTKVVVDEKEYHIFREADILGKFDHLCRYSLMLLYCHCFC